jgi:hypothetical protein
VNSSYFLCQLFMVTKLGLCLVYFEEKLQDLLISVTKLLFQRTRGSTNYGPDPERWF